MEEITMLLSPCGINCSECPIGENCAGGCRVSGGKPFYIESFDVEVCPIFDCAVNKNSYETCAECSDLPCQLFFDWRDPDMTQEEHNKGIEENVVVLRSYKK
jgi:hypothetical protein